MSALPIGRVESHPGGPLHPAEALRRLAALPRPASVRDGRSGWVVVTAAPTETVVVTAPDDPFAVLREMTNHQNGARRRAAPGDPGWLGIMTHEAGRALERVSARHAEPEWPPRMYMARYPSALWCHPAHGALLAGERRHARVLADALARPSPDGESPFLAGEARGAPSLDMDRAEHRRAFDAIAAAIAAGDVYQVNLTCSIRGRWRGHPLAFHERLVGSTPPPFCAYLDTGPAVISSNSPELLIAYDARSRVAVSGPIKGTTAAGRSAREADALAAALAESEKDRAEHVMIVDLVRNDLGRVCSPGTVRTGPLMAPLRLSRVQHLVTDVFGRLAPGLGPADLLTALYPGGSVIGAPKIAAMEFIDRLEAAARGVYCGAMGRLSPSGDLSLSLPIRTATLTSSTPHEWDVAYGAGGGIVADSVADAEYDELLLKASRALEILRNV